jgi:hypothetical protein
MPQRPPRQRLSSNAPGSRNAIGRISQRPFTRANGHHLRQATHKPVAGFANQVVNDKGRYRQFVSGYGKRLHKRRFRRSISQKSQRQQPKDIPIEAFVTLTALYHSLFGLASPQQTTRSIVRDGEHWLKWSAAQWHSWTLARFYGTYVSSSRSGSLGVEKSLEVYKRTQS